MNKIKLSAKLLVILFIMSGSYACSDDEVEYRGILENRPVGKVGVWVIDGQPYAVSKKAELDEENGPLGIGACVEIELDGKIVKEIETKEPDECDENRSTAEQQ
jgi:hypothetical protein